MRLETTRNLSIIQPSYKQESIIAIADELRINVIYDENEFIIKNIGEDATNFINKNAKVSLSGKVIVYRWNELI